VPLLAFLPPWSSGKDPDRHSGIRGNSTYSILLTVDVITMANGPAFETLRNHPGDHLLSLGSWGVKVGVM
jgi:hypothetical protein